MGVSCEGEREREYERKEYERKYTVIRVDGVCWLMIVCGDRCDDYEVNMIDGGGDRRWVLWSSGCVGVITAGVRAACHVGEDRRADVGGGEGGIVGREGVHARVLAGVGVLAGALVGVVEVVSRRQGRQDRQCRLRRHRGCRRLFVYVRR